MIWRYTWHCFHLLNSEENILRFWHDFHGELIRIMAVHFTVDAQFNRIIESNVMYTSIPHLFLSLDEYNALIIQ